MMFAVASSLLLVGVGAAVDYSGMRSVRSNIQNFADVAVLAAAGSGEENKAELKKIAEAAIAANNFDGGTYSVSVNLSKDGFITVDVGTSYNMAIMGIFGKSTSDVKASAEAPLALAEPIDIALVLDVTGSMSGTKIDDLKTAATALIDILDEADNDNVRVSVIPFAQYVNVGLSRRSASWLDVPADSSTTGAETCYMTKDVTSTSNCTTTTTPTSTCYNDGVPYTCGGGDKTTCDYTYGPEYEVCYTPTSNSTWRGCVGSRNTPWNERARKGSTLIPGVMNINCNQEILTLTNDLDVVRSNITSLNANGNTYIPAGLIWGWRALNYEEPLTEALSTKDKNASRVLILMTDGANTKSVNGTLHTGSDIDNANSVTKNLCLNLKADKIDMYTIAYDFSDPTTINMLEKCASTKDQFFSAADGATLKKTFENIGASLNKLRLTN